jgi:hypothetical protein
VVGVSFIWITDYTGLDASNMDLRFTERWH